MANSRSIVLCCAFVFILLILAAEAQLAVQDEGCQTPDKGVGMCILIYSCQPIMNILRQVSRHDPGSVSNLLKSYQCGFDGTNPKVCCSDKPISVSGITSSSSYLSGHRNFALLPKNYGVINIFNLIYGDQANLFEFPWMTLLSYKTKRGSDFKCGGTIINDRYILTAAHCITNLKFPLLGVRVGEHDLSTPVDCVGTENEQICAPPFQDLAIEEIIPHPEYNKSAYTNDIGLLRVPRIDLSLENMKPICLPLEKDFNYTDKTGVVPGWGVTEMGHSSSVLLQIRLGIASLESCQKAYKNVANIQHNQLCADGRFKSDTCFGDSGGPLQVVETDLHQNHRYVQQGIVSFGDAVCGSKGLPRVFTRVDNYVNWILDTIKP